MRDGEDEISSFREVYEAVFPVLIKVVYHIVGSMEVAEDICQETFIRFYKKGAEHTNSKTLKGLDFQFLKKI